MTEEIGKHKGAVETLLHEKKELSRLLQIVNSQLERHLAALEEKGVDTDQFIQQVQQQGQQGNRQQQQGNQRQNNQRKQRNQENRQQGRNQNNSRNRGNQNSRSRDNREEENSGDQDFNPL